MKNFLMENKNILFFIFSVFIIWRLFLVIPEFLGNRFLAQHPGYIGSTVWANFDGVHYLLISVFGYRQFEQAFFPVFPLFIRFISSTFNILPLDSAILVVSISLLGSLFLFFKLIRLDFSESIAKWSVLFFLLFPTSFFLGSIYTESLFLFFVFLSFYSARKKKWFFASISAGIASGIRLVGIFILPALILEYIISKKNIKSLNFKDFINFISILLLSPLGLFSYMFFLWKNYSDPLLFLHLQPGFGANRSGGDIILLPQVIYRYIKIFLTIPITNHDFWIALLELIIFLLFMIILIVFWRNIRPSYLLFSLSSILLPTLTGTLSSVPRYVLVAFPVFIIFAIIKKKLYKVLLLIIFISLLSLLTMYFSRGYFVA